MSTYTYDHDFVRITRKDRSELEGYLVQLDGDIVTLTFMGVNTAIYLPAVHLKVLHHGTVSLLTQARQPGNKKEYKPMENVPTQVESSIQYIFSNNLPLNATSLHHVITTLYPSPITSSQMWEYMTNKYGWDKNLDFTSGTRIN